MTPPRVLRARGTHLYPGARAALDGDTPDTPTPCLVEFADGAAATGEIAPDGAGRALLVTRPYRTAAGTAIPAKRWRLELGLDGACRVTARADGIEPRRGAHI